MINYTFFKNPYLGEFKHAKIFAKVSKTICFLLFKAFQRAIKSRNPMTGSRSKYRFSRVKVK